MTFSVALNDVMDDIGASLKVRETKTETATSCAILQTIAHHPSKLYIFGSWYESSSTACLKSDIDQALIYHCFPVATKLASCPRPISCLVIPDNQVT